MAAPTLPIAEYLNLVGTEVGVSGWIEVDQERINAFAACTLDEQFIHVEPVRAAETQFGGTIAHGFLTLALIVPMAFEAVPTIEGAKISVNFGLSTVKFLTPVRSGGLIRSRFELLDVLQRKPGQWQSTINVTVEIAGESRPALIAEWITLTTL